MTEKEIRQKVVDTALSYLGCKESDGSHRKIIDLYNSHTPRARGYKVTYTDAWCATFVSAIGIQLGYTDIMPTECSCTKMIELYKKLGRWHEPDDYKPQIADIILYDWNDSGKGENKGKPEHVGIVEKVENGNITVIEGNHDGSDADRIDGVEKRVLAVNGRYIRGFCLPDYASKATAEAPSAPVVETPAKKPEPAAPKYVIGKVYHLQVNDLSVRVAAGTQARRKTYSQLTANAKKHAYSTGRLKKGTAVTCLETKQVGEDIWMRIPSGWCAAFYEGQYYIK